MLRIDYRAALLVLLFLGLWSGSGLAALYLNEAASANLSGLLDEDGDIEDWFELHNDGPNAVNLLGYALTDDPEEPEQWVLPQVTLAAGDYLLVFASGKDRTEGELHANFKLSSEGEPLELRDQMGDLIDAIVLVPLLPDVSMGRGPGGDWYVFDTPSPGAANTGTTYLGITPMPSFSPERGFYAGPLQVQINAEAVDDLAVTMDGSPPTDYLGSAQTMVAVDATTSLRARALRPGWLPSRIATHSFIIAEPTGLPVISLTMDPYDLWDFNQGIYVFGPDDYEHSWPYLGANFWEDWERKAHWEFFAPEGVFAADGGTKIHGGYSRGYDQRSLRLIFRDEYGVDELDYQAFPNRPDLQSFKRLIIRNCGQDFPYAHLRDVLACAIASESGLGLMSARAAAVFINGEYWGYMNLRERQDRYYLADNYGVDEDNLDFIEGAWSVVEGDADHWDQLYAFITTHDMAESANYEYVKTQMDVENFATYHVFNIYLAHTDWPDHNVKRWRPRTAEGRWQWLFQDMDHTLGAGNGTPDHNTLDYATNQDPDVWGNPQWSTIVLYRLLQNQEFSECFLADYADRLNREFRPSPMHAHLDSIIATIEAEIPRHRLRWSIGSAWATRLAPIRSFINARGAYARQHVMEYFGIHDTLHLSLDVSPAAPLLHLFRCRVLHCHGTFTFLLT